MNKKIALIIMITSLFNTACAGGAGKTIKLHGNFCGPNYPSLSATTRAEARAELKSIRPVDDLDKLCQIHDLCYVSRGVGNHVCDGQLQAELMSFRGNSTKCSRKASNMSAALMMSSPMLTKDNSNKKGLVTDTMSTAMDIPAAAWTKAPYIIAYTAVLPINALGAVVNAGEKAPDTCDRIDNSRGHYDYKK